MISLCVIKLDLSFELFGASYELGRSPDQITLRSLLAEAQEMSQDQRFQHWFGGAHPLHQ
jgi:hypothetical protein